jgi:hypothetical protein
MGHVPDGTLEVLFMLPSDGTLPPFSTSNQASRLWPAIGTKIPDQCRKRFAVVRHHILLTAQSPKPTLLSALVSAHNALGHLQLAAWQAAGQVHPSQNEETNDMLRMTDAASEHGNEGRAREPRVNGLPQPAVSRLHASWEWRSDPACWTALGIRHSFMRCRAVSQLVAKMTMGLSVVLIPTIDSNE